MMYISVFVVLCLFVDGLSLSNETATGTGTSTPSPSRTYAPDPPPPFALPQLSFQRNLDTFEVIGSVAHPSPLSITTSFLRPPHGTSVEASSCLDFKSGVRESASLPLTVDPLLSNSSDSPHRIPIVYRQPGPLSVQHAGPRIVQMVVWRIVRSPPPLPSGLKLEAVINIWRDEVLPASAGGIDQTYRHSVFFAVNDTSPTAAPVIPSIPEGLLQVCHGDPFQTAPLRGTNFSRPVHPLSGTIAGVDTSDYFEGIVLDPLLIPLHPRFAGAVAASPQRLGGVFLDNKNLFYTAGSRRAVPYLADVGSYSVRLYSIDEHHYCVPCFYSVTTVTAPLLKDSPLENEQTSTAGVSGSGSPLLYLALLASIIAAIVVPLQLLCLWPLRTVIMACLYMSSSCLLKDSSYFERASLGNVRWYAFLDVAGDDLGMMYNVFIWLGFSLFACMCIDVAMYTVKGTSAQVSRVHMEFSHRAPPAWTINCVFMFLPLVWFSAAAVIFDEDVAFTTVDTVIMYALFLLMAIVVIAFSFAYLYYINRVAHVVPIENMACFLAVTTPSWAYSVMKHTWRSQCWHGCEGYESLVSKLFVVFSWVRQRAYWYHVVDLFFTALLAIIAAIPRISCSVVFYVLVVVLLGQLLIIAKFQPSNISNILLVSENVCSVVVTVLLIGLRSKEFIFVCILVLTFAAALFQVFLVVLGLILQRFYRECHCYCAVDVDRIENLETRGTSGIERCPDKPTGTFDREDYRWLTFETAPTFEDKRQNGVDPLAMSPNYTLYEDMLKYYSMSSSNLDVPANLAKIPLHAVLSEHVHGAVAFHGQASTAAAHSSFDERGVRDHCTPDASTSIRVISGSEWIPPIAPNSATACEQSMSTKSRRKFHKRSASAKPLVRDIAPRNRAHNNELVQEPLASPDTISKLRNKPALSPYQYS